MKTIQANDPSHITKPANSNQSSLNFPQLSPKEKSEIDLHAVMWCFMGNHSFRRFENPFGKKLLNALNIVYKPPSRSGPLLESIFSMTKNCCMVQG